MLFYFILWLWNIQTDWTGEVWSGWIWASNRVNSGHGLYIAIHNRCHRLLHDVCQTHKERPCLLINPCNVIVTSIYWKSWARWPNDDPWLSMSMSILQDSIIRLKMWLGTFEVVSKLGQQSNPPHHIPSLSNASDAWRVILPEMIFSLLFFYPVSWLHPPG